jgi:hypothetical protein
MTWLSLQSRKVIGLPEEILDDYVEETSQNVGYVVETIHGTSL